MVLNARSLINKTCTDELELLVSTNDIDITVPDEAVAVSGMTLVRNDRTYGTGGGVALYVNNKIPFKIRKDLNDLSLYRCSSNVYVDKFQLR